MSRLSPRTYTAISAVILAVTLFILKAMGRIVVGAGGFALWTPDTVGTRTSQLFADPYTSSHLLHGILFFGFLWFVARRLPLGIRALLALLIEAGWEILENSPIIINRYRSATAAYDYTGDSIFNSTGDILFCMLGFWLAWKLPVRWSLALIVLVEVGMLLWVRDNLTLNILMLIYPLNAIKAWQMGTAFP